MFLFEHALCERGSAGRGRAKLGSMQEKRDCQSRALGSLGKVGRTDWVSERLCHSVRWSGCMCAPISHTCIRHKFVCGFPLDVVLFSFVSTLFHNPTFFLWSWSPFSAAKFSSVPAFAPHPQNVCVCVPAVSTNSHHLLCAGTRPLLGNAGKCQQSRFSHWCVLQKFSK